MTHSTLRNDILRSMSAMTVPVQAAKYSTVQAAKDRKQPINEKPKAAGPFVRSEAFDSPDAAAVAACRSALSGGAASTEYGGVVYKDEDGKFYFSQPQTSGSEDDLNIRVQLPKTAQVAAEFHTHSGEKNTDAFSPGDQRRAKATKLPSYVCDSHTGNVVGFDPKASKGQANLDGFRKGRHVAALKEPTVRDELTAAFTRTK